jgi:hypothetical protein
MKTDPTVQIEGYEFKRVYTDTDGISETQIGIYVVVCLVDGDPQRVVDIGTTGEGSDPVVMKTSNLQYRLQNHDRDDCWEEACDGELGYCVKYVRDDTERLELEKELRWKFAPPCGSDTWDQPGTVGWGQTKELELAYGSQGVAEIDLEAFR